jgi:hypothetical protein
MTSVSASRKDLLKETAASRGAQRVFRSLTYGAYHATRPAPGPPIPPRGGAGRVAANSFGNRSDVIASAGSARQVPHVRNELHRAGVKGASYAFNGGETAGALSPVPNPPRRRQPNRASHGNRAIHRRTVTPFRLGAGR